MKKPFYIVAISLVLLVVVLVLVFSVGATVSVSTEEKGTITYTYGDVSFTEELTAEEVKAVAEVLNGKRQESSVFGGTPTCGFDKAISITIGDTSFGLACDKCGTVLNYSTMRYIHISEGERAILEELFTARGGKFPCV